MSVLKFSSKIFKAYYSVIFYLINLEFPFINYYVFYIFLPSRPLSPNKESIQKNKFLAGPNPFLI